MNQRGSRNHMIDGYSTHSPAQIRHLEYVDGGNHEPSAGSYNRGTMEMLREGTPPQNALQNQFIVQNPRFCQPEFTMVPTTVAGPPFQQSQIAYIGGPNIGQMPPVIIQSINNSAGVDGWYKQAGQQFPNSCRPSYNHDALRLPLPTSYIYN